MSEQILRRRSALISHPVVEEKEVRGDQYGLGIAMAVALAAMAILALVALFQGVFTPVQENSPAVPIHTSTTVQQAPSLQ